MGILGPICNSSLSIHGRYIVCSPCQKVRDICHRSYAVDPKPPVLYVASSRSTLVISISGGMGLSMSWHTENGHVTGFVRHILSVPLYVGSMIPMPLASMVLCLTMDDLATISV